MYQVFEAALEVRFRECPGHRKIIRKEYALRPNTGAEDIERTVDFRRCFYPGWRVEMIMIFERHFIEISVCPGCRFPPPESQEYQEPDMEWYNSVALLLI